MHLVMIGGSDAGISAALRAREQQYDGSEVVRGRNKARHVLLVDWIANFALIEVFPAWHNAIGLGWVMVCFAVISVLAIGFVSRWLPETKGLSVEEAVSVFERQAGEKGGGRVTERPARASHPAG